jgi:hypothetical protein
MDPALASQSTSDLGGLSGPEALSREAAPHSRRMIAILVDIANNGETESVRVTAARAVLELAKFPATLAPKRISELRHAGSADELAAKRERLRLARMAERRGETG